MQQLVEPCPTAPACTDLHQVERDVLAAELGRPLAALAGDVLYRLYRVVLRDLVLLGLQQPHHGADRTARDLPDVGGLLHGTAVGHVLLRRGDVEQQLAKRRHHAPPHALVLILQCKGSQRAATSIQHCFHA